MVLVSALEESAGQRQRKVNGPSERTIQDGFWSVMDSGPSWVFTTCFDASSALVCCFCACDNVKKSEAPAMTLPFLSPDFYSSLVFSSMRR